MYIYKTELKTPDFFAIFLIDNGKTKLIFIQRKDIKKIEIEDNVIYIRTMYDFFEFNKENIENFKKFTEDLINFLGYTLKENKE